MKNGMKQLQVHRFTLVIPVVERNMSYSAYTVKLSDGLIAQQVKIVSNTGTLIACVFVWQRVVRQNVVSDPGQIVCEISYHLSLR